MNLESAEFEAKSKSEINVTSSVEIFKYKPTDQVNLIDDANVQDCNNTMNTTDSFKNKINSQVDLIDDTIIQDCNNTMNSTDTLVDINKEIIKDSTFSEINIKTDNSQLNNSKINWSLQPTLICLAFEEYQKYRNNYLKCCQWSPDGTCLLTASNDNKLRIFELPHNTDIQELTPVLRMNSLDLIYDYQWYPFMNSSYPDSCFFAAAARRSAVVLWDAYFGTKRTCFQPINHLEEAISPYSLAFTKDGYRLICGFNKFIQIFDLTQLSNKGTRIPKLGIKSELRGIISSISSSPHHAGLFACASYSSDAALYHETLSNSNIDKPVIEFLRNNDSNSGITQIEFSPTNSNLVVTASRCTYAHMNVWDIRQPGTPLFAVAQRDVRTNQRIQFAFDPSGKYILSGNHEGYVTVHSLDESVPIGNDDFVLAEKYKWKVHDDVVNGLTIHPSKNIFATGSGQRKLIPVWKREGMLKTEMVTSDGDCDNNDSSSDDESDDDEQYVREECGLKIWKFSEL